jgi:16S rRNA (guanine527-N7)-methyltransferase
MEQILALFPALTEVQIRQLEQLGPLYRTWNQKINVISRRDIEQLYPHHVLHSLLLAKVIAFKARAQILDLGTGGGFPGIPLAILFPEVQFTLIDGTRKKIRVVEEVATALQLQNTNPIHVRAEEHRGQYDFVISRAVASLDKLVNWSRRLIHLKHKHALPNGLLALKGGKIEDERKALPKGEYAEVFPLSEWVNDPYFEQKYVVYVQA